MEGAAALASYMEESTGGKGRILFTGKGEIMMKNLIEYAPEKFEISKCSIASTDFVGALKHFKPDVVVVCLMDETRDMLRMYGIMKEQPEYVNIPIVAIGKNDDCENFKKLVVQKFMEVFVRPFDTDRMWQCVESFVKVSRDNPYIPPEEEDVPHTPVAPAASAPGLEEESAIEKRLVKRIERETRIEGRRTILVVDDDILMLNTIKQFLQDLYDVTIVPTGKLAIKFLNKKFADLVLLDYMMPEMDGPMVLQEIRQNTPHPNVPVLFLTGVSDREQVIRGLEFRPEGYLLKPVTREALLERVMEIMLGL